MKLYLAGIRSYQLDLGIESSAFSDPRLERAIQGIKRDLNEPERRTRTPLTRPYIICILHHLQPNTYDHAVIQAAFTLAFAGFLRVGQFTYKELDKELGASYQNWFLAKGSVRIRGKGSYIELILPSSKTDPFRKGITLTIAASNDAACPIHAIQHFFSLDTHHPPHSTLFCHGRVEQQAFTREYVVQQLQHLALTAGLGQGSWNGHSFRRGAAT